MLKSLVAFLVSVSLAVSVPTVAVSQNLIEPGTCELIVKSEPSLDSARSYARNIDDTRFVKIFESSNGWYAISIGALKPHEEEAIISSWKASGKIPDDSRCSDGKKFIAQYDWRTGDRVYSGTPSSDDDNVGRNTLLVWGGAALLLACALGADCFGSGESNTSSPLHFANNCYEDVKVAVHYLDTEDKWRTRGWFNIDAGESTDLYYVNETLRTKNSIVYFYAQSLDGSDVWGGDTLIEFGDEDLSMRQYQTSTGNINIGLNCN